MSLDLANSDGLTGPATEDSASLSLLSSRLSIDCDRFNTVPGLPDPPIALSPGCGDLEGDRGVEEKGGGVVTVVTVVSWL